LLVLPDGIDRYLRQQRSEVASADGYVAAIEGEFALLRDRLVPGDALDIGCGLGGMSALIAHHCGGMLHLMDGTGWADRRTGFGPDMDAFNDMHLTAEMMRLNGVARYKPWPIGAADIPPVDNIVSLLSWGWHYPVETYLPLARRILRPGGRLILDIRAGTLGRHTLGGHFTALPDIGPTSGHKGHRTVWQRRVGG